ncbi:hypothetical protein SLS58_009702 [Diplodia intermedia]|uniref:Uncharacterized protein n=1 Tax=Diplodia intermedia TaxID=856260 RepID=A0ABR3TB66_9PEZI
MNWIESAKTPKEALYRANNPPEHLADVLRSTFDHFASETDEVCQVSNTAFNWIMHGYEAVTLGFLDCFLKFEDRYKQGVHNLDEIIRSQPSLFTITFQGDPSPPGRASETESVTKALAPGQYADIILMKKRQVRRKCAYLNQAQVSTCQRELADYLYNNKRDGHKIGIDGVAAKIGIALFCADILVDGSMENTFPESNLMRYAQNHVCRHIKDTTPTRKHALKMAGSICRTFSDPECLKRWTSGAASSILEFFQQADVSMRILEWFDELEEGSLSEPHLQWAKDILRLHFGDQWHIIWQIDG